VCVIRYLQKKQKAQKLGTKSVTREGEYAMQVTH